MSPAPEAAPLGRTAYAAPCGTQSALGAARRAKTNSATGLASTGAAPMAADAVPPPAPPRRRPRQRSCLGAPGGGLPPALLAIPNRAIARTPVMPAAAPPPRGLTPTATRAASASSSTSILGPRKSLGTTWLAISPGGSEASRGTLLRPASGPPPPPPPPRPPLAPPPSRLLPPTGFLRLPHGVRARLTGADSPARTCSCARHAPCAILTRGPRHSRPLAAYDISRSLRPGSSRSPPTWRGASHQITRHCCRRSPTSCFSPARPCTSNVARRTGSATFPTSSSYATSPPSVLLEIPTGPSSPASPALFARPSCFSPCGALGILARLPSPHACSASGTRTRSNARSSALIPAGSPPSAHALPAPFCLKPTSASPTPTPSPPCSSATAALRYAPHRLMGGGTGRDHDPGADTDLHTTGASAASAMGGGAARARADGAPAGAISTAPRGALSPLAAGGTPADAGIRADGTGTQASQWPHPQPRPLLHLRPRWWAGRRARTKAGGTSMAPLPHKRKRWRARWQAPTQAGGAGETGPSSSLLCPRPQWRA